MRLSKYISFVKQFLKTKGKKPNKNDYTVQSFTVTVNLFELLLLWNMSHKAAVFLLTS